MKVKIGDKIIDSNDEPIMIILSEEEKSLLSSMGSARQFCSYPDSMDIRAVQDFMLLPFESD